MNSNDIKKRLVNMVADKIDATGLLPWDKGFLGSLTTPVNRVSKKEYRGINAFMLRVYGAETNEFVTYKQAQALGGKVKPGEHGIPVVWYTQWNTTKQKPYDKEEYEDGDKVVPYLKYSTVFELSQCEGIERFRVNESEREVHNRSDIAEWLKEFTANTGVTITHSLGTACYRPAFHQICIRDIGEFKSDDFYYSTLFHECTHSTGIALRRYEPAKFGSVKYSKEEVVAELGSLFMRVHFGIDGQIVEDNSVTYIADWSSKLRENPDWLISGANAAQKAYDFMLERGGVL